MKTKFLSTSAVLLVSLCAHVEVANSQEQAKTTGAATPTVGEVIVTAQRREENIQNVPLAVSAFGGEQLSKSMVRDSFDLALLTPGLSFKNALSNAVPTLRGIGTAIPATGAENSVATYVDGVYIATLYEAAVSLLGVERVEVLKGPQGTLYGRNSTGGVINVITLDPGSEFQAKANFEYGNYQTISGAAYVGGPIDDVVSANLIATGKHQGKGYGHNLATGKETNRLDYDYGVRGKVVIQPSDDTQIKLVADLSRTRSTFPIWRTQPGTQPIGAAFYGPVPQGGIYDINSDVEGKYKKRQWGVSATLEHDFGAVKLVDIVAYRKSRLSNSVDVDGSPLPLFSFIYQNVDDQFSNELRLESAPTSNIKWTVGAYYFDSHAGEDPRTGLLDPAFLGGLTRIDVQSKIGGPSKAVFGQTTIPLTPTTNLTAGLRYTHEKKKMVGANFSTLEIPGVGPVTLPTPGDMSAQDSWDSLSRRVSVDQKLATDVMAYASYSRGYKSGSYTSNSFDGVPYAQERLDAYELGMKSDLFGGRVRLNADVYYYDYKDMQVSQVIGTTNAVIINNAGAARVKGFELEAFAAVTENLKVSLSASLSDGEFRDYENAPSYVPSPTGIGAEQIFIDAKGKKLPYLPEQSYTLSADYTVPMDNGSRVEMNGVVFCSSKYYLGPDNLDRQSAYTLINATVSWVSPGERFRIGVWGKNLTNEKLLVNTLPSPFWLTYTYGAPREYGIALQASF